MAAKGIKQCYKTQTCFSSRKLYRTFVGLFRGEASSLVDE